MTDVQRSIDHGQLRVLVDGPCDTLAALMTAQLPTSRELADGLELLDQARACFTRAIVLPNREEDLT